MTKKTENNIIRKDNGLIELLKNDNKLDRDQKMSYISMANLYLENFSSHISKTSLEMNDEMPLGIDTWKDFLNYPVVRKYIQSFKDEQIASIADEGLMKGDKNAVNIKKVMQDQGPIVNNSNIVLIRLPEKVDFNE